MLVATRDHEPNAKGKHFAFDEPPRSGISRLTGAVQLLGSLIGIPLALASGYSIYKSNFSAEASCQTLRASIITMLDRKADASSLRLLVQRDLATFERDCALVDADAAAAFKNLLPAVQPARQAVAKPKAETVKAEQPKIEPAKAEPVKVEAVKAEPKAEPAKMQAAAPVKRDDKNAAEAKKDVVLDSKLEAKPEAKQEAKQETKQEAKAEPAPARVESAAVDAKWIASMRDALRESAAAPQPVETPAQLAPPSAALAPPMPAPVVVSTPPAPRPDVLAKSGSDRPVPPADIPNVAPKPDHPVPPGSIPNADAQPAAN